MWSTPPYSFWQGSMSKCEQTETWTSFQCFCDADENMQQTEKLVSECKNICSTGWLLKGAGRKLSLLRHCLWCCNLTHYCCCCVCVCVCVCLCACVFVYVCVCVFHHSSRFCEPRLAGVAESTGGKKERLLGQLSTVRACNRGWFQCQKRKGYSWRWFRVLGSLLLTFENRLRLTDR
jgi:hypothetical protein